MLQLKLKANGLTKFRKTPAVDREDLKTNNFTRYSTLPLTSHSHKLLILSFNKFKLYISKLKDILFTIIPSKFIEQSHSETLTVTELVLKFSVFYGTRKFVIFLITTRHLCLS